MIFEGGLHKLEYSIASFDELGRVEIRHKWTIMPFNAKQKKPSKGNSLVFPERLENVYIILK